MAENLLARLAVAGVLERRHRRLRVSPRFLAHAEGTAGRLRLTGHASTDAVLDASLRAWDEYEGDTRTAAVFLEALLAERDQLGALRPVFPTLETFAAA